MNAQRRFSLLTLLGHCTAAISFAVLIIALLLWPQSINSSVRFEIPGPSYAQVELVSWHGMIIVGVVEPERPTGNRAWWRRRPRTGVSDLILDEGRLFAADAYGWAIGLPHVVVAALAVVPIAWWLLIFRSRSQRDHRAEQGLCLECGYDIRCATTLCPECGTPIAPPPLHPEPGGVTSAAY